MLRDRNLIPLSRQHQHALALCVRIDRATQAGDVDLEAWQAEIQEIYEQEIAVHFAAEENELFPAASRFPELQQLMAELLSDHAALRELCAEATAHKFNREKLQAFGARLSTHIRKEERQLFEAMQRLLTPEDLARIGAALDRALAASSDTCILPSAATRLRGKDET